MNSGFFPLCPRLSGEWLIILIKKRFSIIEQKFSIFPSYARYFVAAGLIRFRHAFDDDGVAGD